MYQASICFFSYLRASPFGPVAVLWSLYPAGPGLCRVVLSSPRATARQILTESYPGSKASSCPEIDTLLDQIAAYLEGEDILFSLDVVRLELCSTFQQKVLRAEAAIARGRVSTYQNIAQHALHPKAARSVGMVCANNPFPIIIPCHRVVRAGGSLGGYQGGAHMKRALLEMEGVSFRDADHVAISDFF